MTRHFGVYGLWLERGKLVLVRKARGPYTGLLDLPGGAAEPGETTEETLRRELREEAGVGLTDIRLSYPFSIRVHADSAGHPINFHHEGVIADVRVAGQIRYNISDQDVAGVVLAEDLVSDQLSPLATEALRLFPRFAADMARTQPRNRPATGRLRRP